MQQQMSNPNIENTELEEVPPAQQEPASLVPHLQGDNDNNQQNQDDEVQGGIKISKNMILKIIVLIILFLALSFILVNMFKDPIKRSKDLFKYKDNQNVVEISGLDQQGFRSFYYYTKMVKMSRQNAKSKTKFDGINNHQFQQISFQELYGIFKVLKAIQYSKDYVDLVQKDDQNEDQTQLTPVDQDFIEQPFNYTNYFLPVANQFSCGSCYSFPIAATIQYIYKRYKNITVKLSEQQLIDCSSEDQTIDGCKAGNMTKGFQYAMKVGLVENDLYPYRSKSGHSFPCRKEIIDNPNVVKYKIDGFNILPKDCAAIQIELSKGNTVASMISIGQLTKYSSKQKSAFRNCPKDPFNHAITIVGQTAQQQWIIRNSWGSYFGKDGYFTMKGNNTCGICTYSIVPYFISTQQTP